MGRLTLKVIPGASKPDIQFEPNPPSGGAITKGRAHVPALRVRLTSPPLDGRANAALVDWLSELSGTPVRIAAGSKSRTKTIEFATDEASFLGAVRTAWEGQKSKRRK
ncbi:MAG: DUF167 domain-containing protein, partial [Candidatus Micrarchaeota archaeon]|nr:DUF167 domain-containing protein [Candidatus Micrarchaeota archaeon]